MPADERDLRFFYGAFVTADTADPDVTVTLECITWPARGFFTSFSLATYFKSGSRFTIIETPAVQ
ncbi:hypothetical protein P9139_04570 [Curtobacterium flaccumfaciens]|nr:hypothetical protein P9139_04570 [Curtobacterium flaccumfaciens]